MVFHTFVMYAHTLICAYNQYQINGDSKLHFTIELKQFFVNLVYNFKKLNELNKLQNNSIWYKIKVKKTCELF